MQHGHGTLSAFGHVNRASTLAPWLVNCAGGAWLVDRTPAFSSGLVQRASASATRLVNSAPALSLRLIDCAPALPSGLINCAPCPFWLVNSASTLPMGLVDRAPASLGLVNCTSAGSTRLVNRASAGSRWLINCTTHVYVSILSSLFQVFMIRKIFSAGRKTRTNWKRLPSSASYRA